MTIDLTVQVPGDGSIALAWQASFRARSYSLLVVRTGAVPAHTAVQLTAGTTAYRIDNLSRHQRYRVAVAAASRDGTECSPWLWVTPRNGVPPLRDTRGGGLATCLATLRQITVMPQDQRLTVYWQRGPGFCDALALEVHRGDRLVRTITLEPEVTSIALDRGRGVRLQNGETYGIRLQSRFNGLVGGTSPLVLCAPAAQGEERAANQQLPQKSLVYPFLTLSPELAFFDQGDVAAEGEPGTEAPLICCHCRQAVQWRGYRLCCDGCGAEFIPNGRGDFLEASRLRFGVCRCCLPTKILIQKAGSTSLTCSHSGKEYIRLPGHSGYHLIEDLPYGLCQCCRPRRPLIKKRNTVRCQKSQETHTNQNGRWVLMPSEPVFDAAAIDDLLDAGLADICATGVSRGRRQRR